MRTSVVLAVILLVAACGHETSPGANSAPTPTRVALAVATGLGTGNTLTARLDGVLHSRANADKTACFWMEPAPKQGASLGSIAVVWPHGSRGYANPLRVVNADGQVIGTVGQETSITGGFIDPGSLPVKGCPEIRTAFGG